LAGKSGAKNRKIGPDLNDAGGAALWTVLPVIKSNTIGYSKALQYRHDILPVTTTSTREYISICTYCSENHKIVRMDVNTAWNGNK